MVGDSYSNKFLDIVGRWDEIIQRLIILHDHGVHRVTIKEKINEHDIVLRIMRKENYLIGMINKNVLNLHVPWWVSPLLSEKLFLTKSLEWSLSFCVMEFMFNEQFNISSKFIKDTQALQGRFVMVGILHFILLPFMLIFMIVSFFLQNAQHFHSTRAYLGPRQWSPLALWKFREFNELPHVFESRINSSYSFAVDYIALFHDQNSAIVARCVAFIAGSFVATLLLVSFLSDSVLLHGTLLDHNLLWWLGIFSGLYAAARAMIPDDKKLAGSPEETMEKISAHTHHFPPHWRSHCHAPIVKEEFLDLFPFKIHVFGMEILSIILTPVVLCFSLPQCANHIIDFVR